MIYNPDDYPQQPFQFQKDVERVYQPGGQHKYWTAVAAGGIHKIQFDRMVTLSQDGYVSHEIMKPGKDVWFLLRVNTNYGHAGIIVFNSREFYPIYGYNPVKLRICKHFNRQEILPSQFTIRDKEFMNRVLEDRILPEIFK